MNIEAEKLNTSTGHSPDFYLCSVWLDSFRTAIALHGELENVPDDFSILSVSSALQGYGQGLANEDLGVSSVRARGRFFAQFFGERISPSIFSESYLSTGTCLDLGLAPVITFSQAAINSVASWVQVDSVSTALIKPEFLQLSDYLHRLSVPSGTVSRMVTEFLLVDRIGFTDPSVPGADLDRVAPVITFSQRPRPSFLKIRPEASRRSEGHQGVVNLILLCAQEVADHHLIRISRIDVRPAWSHEYDDDGVVVEIQVQSSTEVRLEYWDAVCEDLDRRLASLPLTDGLFFEDKVSVMVTPD